MASAPQRLTAAAESALVARSRAGDRAALNALLRAHDRLIVAQARRFHGRGVDLDDLAQKGRERFAKCIHSFDPDRGVRFVTYACTAVRREMWNEVCAHGATIRTPKEKQGAAAAEDDATALLRRTISGDREREGRPSLLSRVPSGAESVETVTIDRERDALLRPAIERAIAALPRAQATVAWQRLYPPDGSDGATLAEVGAALGLTRERARQIELLAKARLRAALACGSGEAVGEAVREWRAGAG